MNSSDYIFDWSDIAFGSKKPLNRMCATIIAAPREISSARLKQLIKQYLPVADIILGIAKEEYIDGFDGQPQFKTLNNDKEIQQLIDKVNINSPTNKIYTLEYFQKDLSHIVEKLKPGKMIFINGSWHKMFHVNKIYYQLMKIKTDYELLSPFVDEVEAKEYLKIIEPEITKTFWPSGLTGKLTEAEMLNNANIAAKFSFDYGFQTGVTIGKKVSGAYKHLIFSFNEVVPYQTYAMHHGASREINFTPPQDLSQYDAVHAEVRAVIMAGRQRIDLKDAILFINLLPCPFCARMLTQTEISEIVYSEDHSDGYAVKLLEQAGKKVRRIIL